MRVSLIVAMAHNRVIGRNNALPWRLPEDLKRFKAITMGHPVIMGRRTYESIGRPLPGRANIVVTRSEQFKAPGCTVVRSPQAALDACAGTDEAFVIGGADIYRAFLDRADRLLVTEIDADFEGDAYFPEFDQSQWRESARESMAGAMFPFAFVRRERLPAGD
jgi:dihydrofolate reductase